MPDLLVDGRHVSVSDGATLLDAARSLGIAVPTLCFVEGLRPQASCMVCLVEDERAGRLVPACATQASEGDRIRTDGDRVAAARRRAVEFLLAEHDGDCEAPCTRACPAHADIPRAIRRIASGERRAALALLLQRLPLTWTLALVCPAPCRQACRRKRVDAAIDICSLKRAAAEAGLAGPEPFTPSMRPPSGKRVAIVGAGPAGLSAAYFLARDGHRCLVLEGNDRPGGAMPAPPEVIAADVAVLARLGVEFRLGRAVAAGRDIAALAAGHDALVLATGSRESCAVLLPGVGAGDRAGIFVCGNAALERPTRLAVRSVAGGRRIAESVSAFLAGETPPRQVLRFDSHRGALSAEDLALLARRALLKGGARRAPPADPVAAEALRCLDCDCLRRDTCRLRLLADETGADAHRFAGPEERSIEIIAADSGLSLDPGKCIRCGICVRISEAFGDRPGLSFSGRGPYLRVHVPFGDDLGRALPASAAACVAACPTGALAWDAAIRREPRE